MVVVSLAVLLGVVACGDKGTAPVAAIVDRDNTICQAYAQQLDQIAAPSFDPADTKQTDLPAAKRYLDQVVPLLDSELSDIKAAGRPEDSQDLYASVLDAFVAVLHDEQAAQAAANSGDLQAFQAAFRTDTQDTTELSGVAAQFGLNACAA